MMRYLLSLLFFLPTFCFGQYWSTGIFFGGSNYQGDLVETQFLASETNFAYGAFIRRNINSKFALKASAYSGKLSGGDFNFINRYDRGYSFQTNILQTGMSVEWDIFGQARYDSKGYYRKQFTPYLSAGIGAVMFKPRVYVTDSGGDNPYEGQQYGKFNFSIPMGAGFKYDINQDFSLCIDVATHLPFSDYMDGVSLNGTGLQNNDWFLVGGVALAKWFGVPKRKTMK